MALSLFTEELTKICSLILSDVQSCLTKVKESTQIDNQEEKIDDKSTFAEPTDCEELCIFPPSEEVKTLLTDITSQIQINIKQLRHLPNYDETTYNYFLDFLYDFHFDGDSFIEVLSSDNLLIFAHNLAIFIDSIQACRECQSGNLSIVKEFLSKNPSHKDQPLLNGYTLLYVATANNHLEIMKYLIEEAKCSVNAQNQNDSSANMDTPLHIACSSGHADIVRYLLHKGANCYVQNKKEETPTMIAKHNPALFDIFRNHFVLHYLLQGSRSCDLPTMTIDDEISKLKYDTSLLEYNCTWEFKPLHQLDWQKFAEKESKILCKTLRETSDLDIFLNVEDQMYTVSMRRFLKSGNSTQVNENQAWIRCRGSSVYNFDIVSIWQIMFTQHGCVVDKEKESPQLKSIDIPTIFNSDQFDYRLNSWYNAEEFLNAAIEEAMNQHLRYLTIRTQLLGLITFNLESFSFQDVNRKIAGYIRWLPRFVSVDRTMKRIMPIDNFQDISRQDQPPEPLRKSLLCTLATADSQENEEISLSDEKDESVATENVRLYVNDDKIDNNTNDKDERSSENPTSVLKEEHETISMDDEDAELINNDNTENDHAAKEEEIRTNIKKKREDLDRLNAIMKQYQQTVEEENRKLEDIEKKKMQPSKQNELLNIICDTSGNSLLSDEFALLQKNHEEQEEVLKMKLKELDDIKKKCYDLESDLENERNKVEFYENQRRKEDQVVKDLIVIKYDIPFTDNIQLQVTTVEKYLKTLNFSGKTSSHEEKINICQEISQTNSSSYSWIVEAYSVHHVEMKAICYRTTWIIRHLQKQQNDYRKTLTNCVESFLKRSVKELGKAQIKCNMANWKIFVEIFEMLIKRKREEFEQQFDLYIGQKVKSILDDMIRNASNWWKRLRMETSEYLKKKDIMTLVEELKRNALKQYLMKMEDLCLAGIQRVNTSITAKDLHVQKLKELLETSKDYIGHESHHFSLLSSLIHRIHIILECFRLQLPLFDSSVDLLEKINQNTVVAISTATGSGKSTLLPSLLAADGYEKILVTQPRRLPCNLLSERVNTSMKSSTLSGWAVSGARSSNFSSAPILYLTDGLLKEYLLHRERYLIHQLKTSKRGLVFFIDEVHERSINIDLCLAFLARFLEKNPHLHSKLKIIISSATLNPCIAQLFFEFKFHEIQIKTSTLNRINENSYCSENLIDLVARLHQQIEREEQILCFVKSNTEVTQSIKLLKLLKGLSAFPLIQSQSSMEQQQLIKTKQIFFSTTVAETSLTFPSLKYVIDTGLIHIPVYDPLTDSTELREMNAAESTIKQRQGRLGRTRPGEYYPLYTFDPKNKKFPEPQICQTELSNIEFSLRRLPLKCGLNDLKKWLPNAPSEQAIDTAIKRLHQLDILDLKRDFTSIGLSISKLPDFGSVEMSRAVLAALKDYKCGRDVLRLAAILGVLNTSSILRNLPRKYKKVEGDFMTLLNVMDTILAKKLVQPPCTFNVDNVCQETGLSFMKHYIKRAILRYSLFEKFFRSPNEYCTAAQCSSNGYWEPVARALLNGYSNNVYLSAAEIQGRKHRFICYTAAGITEKQKTAVLDSTSTLARKLSANPVALILARDIRISSDIRARSILSFLGEIQSDWLDRALERNIPMSETEIKLFNDNIKESQDFLLASNGVNCELHDDQLTLAGSAGRVLTTELCVRQKLVVKNEIPLIPVNETDTGLKRKVEDLTEELHIFRPMGWRWRAQKQVKIIFLKEKDQCKIVIKAREKNYKK
ncbi:unnamed protein product, partial [Rotaria socialis]